MLPVFLNDFIGKPQFTLLLIFETTTGPHKPWITVRKKQEYTIFGLVSGGWSVSIVTKWSYIQYIVYYTLQMTATASMISTWIMYI